MEPAFSSQDIPLGVVVAMEVEERHLLALADHVEPGMTSVFVSHRVRFGEAPAVVVRSGIGMVHAAAAPQALIDRHHPRCLLNFGCSGAHHPELLPGDVVIGDRCVHHAAVQILPDGTMRYAGFTTEAAGDIAHRGAERDVVCDPSLVGLARDLSTTKSLTPWPGRATPPQVWVGPIGSADVWTQATERLRALHGEHGTLCEDMEAAAIGRVAWLHGIPFLSIKDISNSEFLEATDLDDFSGFPVEEVGKRSAELIDRIARHLGRQQPAAQLA